MPGGFHPGSDSAVLLLVFPQVLQSPQSLIQNVGDPVAAFRQEELSVGEVFRFEQLARGEIADDHQVLGPAVPVGGIMPAADAGKFFRGHGSVFGDQ